jgi:hypothetical protein
VSQVRFTGEPQQGIVRLAVTHEYLAEQAAAGWMAVCSNRKSLLLETGPAPPPGP